MRRAARSLRSVLATSVVAAVVCVACAAAHATPGAWARQVTNPWFPLKPGTTFVYTGEKDGESGRDIVTVTDRTKVIRGVRSTAVEDRLYLHARLPERTTDWDAQHSRGTVWNFGEPTPGMNNAGRVPRR